MAKVPQEIRWLDVWWQNKIRRWRSLKDIGMIKISLVGDIGSGKTFVSKLFRAPCFFADVEVKRLYKSKT